MLQASGALGVWRRAAVGIDQLVKRGGFLGQLERGSLVFMFHRVVAAADPFRVGYPVEDFEWFCQLLAEAYEVLPLGELERRRRSGRSPSRAVALTFDDGYADNAELAWPILRRYGLPATVFVTTGAVGDGDPLWTSRVPWVLEHGRVPEAPLTVAGVTLQMADRWQRAATAAAICARLKGVDPSRREELIAELQQALGVVEFHGLADEMLSWDQVRQLDAAGFQAGAHTITHPVLSQVDDRTLEREIVGCKQELEQRLGRQVTTFAYPNGTCGDYGDRSVALVRRAGYHSAYTAVYGANGPTTDPYEQRRVVLYADTRAGVALQTERFFYARTR